MVTNDGITAKFLRDCLNANELGDGLLYSAVHRNKFIFDTSSGEWLKWAGDSWVVDEKAEHLAASEGVVEQYATLLDNVSEDLNRAVRENNEGQQAHCREIHKSVIRRISRLRSDRGRNATVKFAWTCPDPLVVTGEQLDTHPWLLACANGVIDLRTGKFRPGRPEEYISKASPVCYEKLNTPAAIFEDWLLEVLSGDEELAAFVQRAFGYAITGLNHEHVFLVLWGAGRNGKGTLVELLSSILGPLAGPIQSEMLLDQGRARSSAGPSPDIMSLRGLRLAFASETDEGRKFSPSRVKWLTGGDTLVGRHPHDRREVHFQPTHTLILLTNNKPSAPAHDLAFWERVRLIPFKLSFVDRQLTGPNERKAKKGLVDELKKEAPGILAWLVRGCLDYQEKGLAPPASVVEATLEYRREEDLLSDFLEEHYDLDGVSQEPASDLFDTFKTWFEKNISKQPFSQKRFGMLMGKRFNKHRKEGVFVYSGLTKKRP